MDKIDTPVEKWITDEKINCKEGILICIRGWKQQEDSEQKTEILEGLYKELETGEKQIKQYNIDI